MRACLEEDEIIVRHPHATRPWQHVLEPLQGYMLLAQRLFERPTEFAQAWNFGPSDEDSKPVEWIVERVLTLWGNKKHWQRDTTLQPHEAMYLKLDCSKAKAKLHWQSQWNLDRALQEIVAWYKAYQSKADMRDVTVKQIAGRQYLHTGIL
jgi:CDP-glucose 4,6-dehydratase